MYDMTVGILAALIVLVILAVALAVIHLLLWGRGL